MAIAIQTLALGVLAAAFFSVLPIAAAQSPAPSYLKLVFSAEGHPLVTSGCLSVVEHQYPNVAWWSQPTASVPNTGAERALRSVIKTFLAKDRDTLLRLSEPSSRESASFDRQAGAFFEQFGELTIKSITRSIRIDDLTIFFLTVDFHGKISEAPLVFKEDGPDTVWFLPKPPPSIEFALAKDWIRADQSSSDVVNCSPEKVDRANIRLPLTSSTSPATKDQSYLYLEGSGVGVGVQQSEDTKRVLITLKKLKEALTAYQGGAPLAELDTLGAQRLQEWWSSADDSERKAYVSAVVSEEPFFVFDLNPLFVVFTRSGKQAPHVLYFAPSRGGTLLWTNSSYGSTFDRIFKTGPLYESATPEPPFSSWLKPKASADGEGKIGLEWQRGVFLTKARSQVEVLEWCCE